jgi:hypothetical protein
MRRTIMRVNDIYYNITYIKTKIRMRRTIMSWEYNDIDCDTNKITLWVRI